MPTRGHACILSQAKKTIAKKAPAKKTAAKAPAKKAPAKKSPAKKAAKSPAKKTAAGEKAMLYAPAEGSNVDVAARLKAAIAVLNDAPLSKVKAEAVTKLLEGALKVL